jgi:hypothetical protein
LLTRFFFLPVAGHELKGAAALLRCGVTSISAPITAILDYRGYRLLCISVLPISTDTLVVGSDDGGQTVRNDDAVLKAKMERIGRILRLKQHTISANYTTSVPVDLEGHLAKNGKYYLIDFARMFPPEAITTQR